MRLISAVSGVRIPAPPPDSNYLSGLGAGVVRVPLYLDSFIANLLIYSPDNISNNLSSSSRE